MSKEPWMYELVHRIPDITAAQIAEMRHIEPVLRSKGMMYRRIKNQRKIHPTEMSFLWDAKPTGDEFTFSHEGETTIVTQHRSSVFFKPSLAEVYAWIRVYFRDEWRRVQFFCLENEQRIPGGTDCYATCTVMGGKKLVLGEPCEFGGHYLREASDE